DINNAESFLQDLQDSTRESLCPFPFFIVACCVVLLWRGSFEWLLGRVCVCVCVGVGVGMGNANGEREREREDIH
ncbi:unnamed protein product, partial [Musa textilis]